IAARSVSVQAVRRNPGAKLGLTASNSLQFAYWRGPFASPRWAPQKAHEGRSKELCKGLR
ncbi:MAG: hypothetical protein V3V47_03120, partial [Desulfobacteria bacterium]